MTRQQQVIESRCQTIDGDFCKLHFGLVRAFGLDKGALLSYMLNLEDVFGPGFYRTSEQIHAELNIPVRTIERSLGWLRQEGYIRWEKPGGFDRRRRYALVHDKLCGMCRDKIQKRQQDGCEGVVLFESVLDKESGQCGDGVDRDEEIQD